MIEKTAKQLKVGDQIRLGHNAYMTATVVQIEGNLIHLFRPYVVACACACQDDEEDGTGRITPLIGTERFHIMRDSDRLYDVW